MKWIIVVGLLALLFVSGCYQPDIEQIAKDWRALGYMEGQSDMIDECREREQEWRDGYTPPEDCIYATDGFMIKLICKDEPLYNQVWTI